jgi:hypothetical protein
MLDSSFKAKFIQAVRRMLRPVVHQLIVYGVPYAAFGRLLKELYVEVAEAEFALPFKKQTDSRLALVTGMTRKEVSQIRRHLLPEPTPEQLEHTLVTHVISRWLAGPPYADRAGQPQVLPYEGASTRAPSFARLVREMGGAEIPVRSVLDELIHVGAAQLQPGGQVRLLATAGQPAQDAESKLVLLGSDPAQLFCTIVHNIEHPDTPFLQRKVVYDNIGADGLRDLREDARKITEQHLRQSNHLLASYDRDRNPKAPGGRRTRVVLGVYYFEEDAAPAQEQTDAPLPGRIRRPS